ncbi:MAG: hypothetical protein WB780_06685 [Candidatus Acidiferrales bacterium]
MAGITPANWIEKEGNYIHNNGNKMKTCCHCKIPKPLKEFRATRREADGRHRECNMCHAEYGRNQRLALHGMSPTDKKLVGARPSKWRLSYLPETTAYW